MKRNIVFLLLVGFMICIGSQIAHAQTLTQYAKQRNQELAERQRQEQANYEKARKEGTMTALKQYLSMYPKGKYTPDVKSRIVELEKKEEQEMYDYACRVETSQAYDAYLKKYPKGRYVNEARGRIEDMELWKRTKSDNTINAYRYYLSASKTKSFAQLANDAITDIESKDAWSLICNSSSRSAIESFVRKYPKSSCLSEAKRKLNEVTAVELYEQGDLQSAYNKFESAGGRSLIDISNRGKYDACLEYVEYKRLNESSVQPELIAFLKKYPSSKYYQSVSNLLALRKAQSLSLFSSKSNFDEVLSYAKDKPTRDKVQHYINEAKRDYRHYKRHQWMKRVLSNGNILQFGIELMDMGFGADNSDHSLFYYNMGLSVKLGNYASPVQLEVGLKPGYVIYSSTVKTTYDSMWGGYTNTYTRTETDAFFHMPLYTKLKLNLCGFYDSKCYIAGLGTYNAVRNKSFEKEYSVGVGMGFAWEEWDWFALYYKQDIESNVKNGNAYVASSIVYYF